MRLHEQIAATSEQFIMELSSSFNGIKVSFIGALLSNYTFQFKQAQLCIFKFEAVRDGHAV